ncbi:MAG: nascent polypeptide-associated complex protein [Candidatus Woesearchaeota archaeon]
MKMNQRDLMNAMKRFGITQQEIEAEEVIIKCTEKEIIIRNPSVIKINLMGEDTFQITGIIQERNKTYEPDENDIKIVIEKTGVSREKAINALKENNGDLASAILSFQRK